MISIKVQWAEEIRCSNSRIIAKTIITWKRISSIRGRNGNRSTEAPTRHSRTLLEIINIKTMGSLHDSNRVETRCKTSFKGIRNLRIITWRTTTKISGINNSSRIRISTTTDTTWTIRLVDRCRQARTTKTTSVEARVTTTIRHKVTTSKTMEIRGNMDNILTWWTKNSMIVVNERITLIFRNLTCNSVASNSMTMDQMTSTTLTSLWEGTVVDTWAGHKTIRTMAHVETTDTTMMTATWTVVEWMEVDTWDGETISMTLLEGKTRWHSVSTTSIKRQNKIVVLTRSWHWIVLCHFAIRNLSDYLSMKMMMYKSYR